MISIRLEDPDGAPLPAARPGQYLTLRVQPDDAAAVGAPQLLPLRAARRRLLPDHRQARTRRRRQRLSAHPARASATSSTIAAPRGTFILDRTHAPVLLISAGIGATPVLAMLHALAEEHSEREIWWLHGARSSRDHSFAAEARALLASLPNVRTHVCYSRPGPDDRRRPRLRQRGPSHRVAARRARAAARRRGIPLRADAVHGRDQRRPGGDRASTPRASTPSRSGPHRV